MTMTRLRVRDMVKGLDWRLTRDGLAHMRNNGRAACGVFTTLSLAGKFRPVCERCLISRPKCRYCGKRKNEEYECSCCDYGCYHLTHRGMS